MKLNFCTLFDSNYITRGIAMYESLLKNSPDFHLYIFAFDDIAYLTLKSLNLVNVTVVSLKEFEDDKLLEIKPSRTKGEYCWTCASSTIWYCLTKLNLPNIIYIDADLIFYNNPQILIDEMGDASVLITEHRYTPEYDLSAENGKYCVQFMFFKNDERGLKVINWWRDECLKWCYNRSEDGKFGDQKYLDDWTTRFEGIHELQHIGGGVAPWNLQQYNFKQKGNKIVLKKKKDKQFVELVFAHFHGLKLYSNNMVCLAPSYYLPKKVIKLLFVPYVNELLLQLNKIIKSNASFAPSVQLEKYVGELFGWKYKPTFNWKDRLHIYKKAFLSLDKNKINIGHNMLIARYNAFDINTLNKWRT